VRRHGEPVRVATLAGEILPLHQQSGCECNRLFSSVPNEFSPCKLLQLDFSPGREDNRASCWKYPANLRQSSSCGRGVLTAPVSVAAWGMASLLSFPPVFQARLRRRFTTLIGTGGWSPNVVVLDSLGN